ncbi:MAG: porin [Pseudomonadota bacterium]
MMNKRMLPAAVGVVLAAGVSVAAADVSLFGHIDASVLGLDQDGGTDDINFRCTTCSIGFKGSEDLGNGLKAIFMLDWQYDIFNRNQASSGTNSLLDRDQWVGLSSEALGKLRVGTISTGYKSHGAMIDPLYRTALQGRDRGLQSALHSGAGEELQGRATNTFRFDSADYSGIKLVAHYTLDSNEGDGEDSNPYGIGASYENGGMLVFADWENNDQSGPAMKAGWKAGGKYTMGMFGVMGQYEHVDDSSTWNDDVTIWHLAGTVSLLGFDAYLGYGKGDNDDNGADYTAWTLAVSHNFSKNTMVYVGHSQVDCDAGTAGAALSACSGVPTGRGEDDMTAFGIKHKF